MFRNSIKEKVYEVEIAGISIEITRKKIKNLYVRVHRSSGRVRVSCPHSIRESELKRFILSKLTWIENQRFKAQERVPIEPYNYDTGEFHYYLGKKYLLEIRDGGKNIVKIEKESLIIEVKTTATKEQKQKLLDSWYRSELKKMIPKIIEDYESRMDVKVQEFGVKKMKTRWGTCNIRKHRIWLNLELAKKPSGCLEMVVVHEMVHLLERLHSARFYKFMDEFMPNWRTFNSELNSSID